MASTEPFSGPTGRHRLPSCPKTALRRRQAQPVGIRLRAGPLGARGAPRLPCVTRLHAHVPAGQQDEPAAALLARLSARACQALPPAPVIDRQRGRHKRIRPVGASCLHSQGTETAKLGRGLQRRARPPLLAIAVCTAFFAMRGVGTPRHIVWQFCVLVQLRSPAAPKDYLPKRRHTMTLIDQNSEGGRALQRVLQQQLKDYLGQDYNDDVLPLYIVVMLAHGTTQALVTENLEVGAAVHLWSALQPAPGTGPC